MTPPVVMLWYLARKPPPPEMMLTCCAGASYFRSPATRDELKQMACFFIDRRKADVGKEGEISGFRDTP